MPRSGDRAPAPNERTPVGGGASLPRSVELMWGLAAPGTRGPRRGLSVEQIVDAAIEVLDEEGFAALSMSRVAEKLGFTAMSLYRYVDSKTTLIELALDRVLGLPPDIPAGTPWRTALEQWAWAEYRLIIEHGGWLSVPTGAPPLGPNNLAWLNTGLAVLGSTRAPESVKLRLVVNLSLFVIGRARAISEIAPAEDSSAGDWAILERVLDAERFPALTTAMRAEAFESQESSWDDLFFGFGLDLLLDGYEQLIDSYEGGAAEAGD